MINMFNVVDKIFGRQDFYILIELFLKSNNTFIKEFGSDQKRFIKFQNNDNFKYMLDDKTIT